MTTGPLHPAARATAEVLAVAVAAAMGTAVQPVGAAAQTTLFDGPAARVTLGGYVRSITGLHDLGYTIPETPLTTATPRRTGFHGQVIRLKWQLEGGTGNAGSGGWRLDVHNRLQARVGADAGDRVVGFGVSAVPDRLVDLEAVLFDEPGLRAWHDLDRLSLTVYTDAADITVGRQAITWGTSAVFPVADLWARFSPFELDTEEKPGIDAVRVLAYPGGVEVDAVLADRGRTEDLSAGVRATIGLADADVWIGAGKFWREAIAMGGITVLLDAVKLRAEAVLPWSLDPGELQPPRATAGIDWISDTFTATGEYHYNGIGADVDGYLDALGDPRVARGETYYLGTHYVGGVTTWSPDRENRVTVGLNALTNLEDPSATLTPFLNYDVGQAARIAIGGLISIGDPPRFTPLPPEFPTEFGAYGTLGYTQLSIYF